MTRASPAGLAIEVGAPAPRYFNSVPPPWRSVAQEVWRRIPEAIAARMDGGVVRLAELEAAAPGELVRLNLVLDALWRERALTILDDAADPTLSIAPTVHDVPLPLGEGVAARPWRLSRFAYVRRSERGDLELETPRRSVRATVRRPAAGTALAALAGPTTEYGLARLAGFGRDRERARALLTLLQIAGAIEPCDAEGNCPEDHDDTLRQWEFHDLLFHTRSRMGRHSEPMGGLFRFKDTIPMPAVTRHNPWTAMAIPLPRPDLGATATADPSLTQVLESRESVRDQDFARPITLAELGAFLYRTARVRGRFETSVGEFTTRPYPAGGAAYELELYLTVNVCRDLARGVYYYDADAHALCFVRAADAAVEGLLDDAWISAARLCRPQVLITLTSRFQRLSWKYSGMAYATTLKNVGVLYQTFYLVATAMGLAGCALGLGNADRMATVTDSDFLQESSVGEFMLGTRLHPSRRAT